VYSSERGRICPECGKPAGDCRCRSGQKGKGKEKGRGKGRGARSGRQAERAQADPRDGVVRVRRETRGRKGKTVTTITGVPLGEDALRDLAGELKRRCGCGGAAKSGVIEIQGDHAEVLVAALEERGYRVKRAGG
jgi:translation initiation factor 1